MAMIRPDYAGAGIVNLMASLNAACGGAALPYAPLAGVDLARLGEQRHIVLLVIDGLGYNHLRRAQPDGALAHHLRARLSSVFPTTTASAVTTYLTGLAPQQHALTGWHMYFSELDAVLAVLPLKPRSEGQLEAEPGELPYRLFGHAPFFTRLARRCVIVSPEAIAASPFNLYHAGGAEIRAYKSAPEMFAQMEAVLREASAPVFLYAYYPELDAAAHKHGIASAQVAAQLAAIDAGFGAFVGAVGGMNALVLASADHGFIDSPPEHLIELEQHPRLADTLARPLCGERRVAYCYVKPGENARFEAYVRGALGHCATLLRGSELIEGGWFGPGPADPRLASRVGDYAIVMNGDWTIKDWVPGEKRHAQIGVHGGVSEDEMFVPLAVAVT